MTSNIIEKTRKNTYNIGGSTGVIIPSGWLQEISVNDETEITLALMESPKHGKYIAIWNQATQTKNKGKL